MKGARERLRGRGFRESHERILLRQLLLCELFKATLHIHDGVLHGGDDARLDSHRDGEIKREGEKERQNKSVYVETWVQSCLQ